jgi:hypothetical protein
LTLDDLGKAEAGAERLSLREAEAAAKLYQRPLAAIFLPEPPREEPAEGQFRRLRDAPELPWPPEMFALYRRIRTRQDEAVERYELLDLHPPWTQHELPVSKDPEISAQRIRAQLVPLTDQLSWRDRGGFRPPALGSMPSSLSACS